MQRGGYTDHWGAGGGGGYGDPGRSGGGGMERATGPYGIGIAAEHEPMMMMQQQQMNMMQAMGGMPGGMPGGMENHQNVMGMDTTWGSMGGAGSMGNMNNNSGMGNMGNMGMMGMGMGMHPMMMQQLMMQQQQQQMGGMGMGHMAGWGNGNAAGWGGSFRGGRGGDWNRAPYQRGAEKKWEKKVAPPRDVLEGFTGEGPACIMVLNEYGQQKTCTVTYNTEVSCKEGSPEKPAVAVTVSVVNEAGKEVAAGAAKCSTKKAAKQRAAAQALLVLYPKLEGLLNEKGLLGPEPEGAEEGDADQGDGGGEDSEARGRKRKYGETGEQGLTALDQAQETIKQYCQEKGQTLELKQRQEGPKHATTFKVEVTVDGSPLVIGEGGRKRQALANAVTAACEALGLPVPENLEESREFPLLAAQTGGGPRAKVEVTLNNAATALRAWAAQRRRAIDIKVEEQGPPHSRTFCAQALLSEEGTTEPLAVRGTGSAPKKKVAQCKAALAACEAFGVTFIGGSRDEEESKTDGGEAEEADAAQEAEAAVPTHATESSTAENGSSEAGEFGGNEGESEGKPESKAD